MKPHEFFQKFSNTPLDDRMKLVDVNNLGLMTLSDIYQRVHELEDKMRPDVIERDKLISYADKFWSDLLNK